MSIADEIDEEYRKKKYYQNKVKRQKCKDKDCKECGWNKVCTSYELEN